VGIDPSVLGPAAAFVFAVMSVVVGILWRAREESTAARFRDMEARLIELAKDRDFWRDLTLRSAGTTDKAIDLAAPRK
jgi:hypothetical protein